MLRLLLQTLSYHWRGNLAVLLGVAVGSAVLTGALLVGDSLQGSLRARSLGQLGWVEQILVTPRFFRDKLAAEVAASAQARVEPAILLRSNVAGPDGRQTRGVTVLGVEPSFFRPGTPPDRFGVAALAWLGRPAADDLRAKVGDTITIRLQKAEAIPREAGLGKKEVTVEEWEVVVAGILDSDQLAARFNPRPDLDSPRNVVVSLGDLQRRLGQPGQANVLLAAGREDALSPALRRCLTLEDWGLVLHTPSTRAKAIMSRYDVDGDGQLAYSEWLSTRVKGRDRPRYAWAIDEAVKPARPRVRTEADLAEAISRTGPYLSLESKQLLLTPSIASAALEAAKEAKLRSAPTLVYLCRLRVGDRRFAGVVAALDPGQFPPLEPFRSVSNDQIVLLGNGWQGERPPPRTPVNVYFKPPESHGPAPDRVEKFALAGFADTKGTADPFLTPDFPGITDREDVGAWDLPFEDEDWKKNISREYGDPYWKEFRAAPKAFISLARGKELWGSSRFGELTSIRLTTGSDPTEAAARFSRILLDRLGQTVGGFRFDDVRANALLASKGGTPFGMLFLGFSFFLILSALLLVGLLYRLNLERRAPQVGLLLAQGYSRSSVRRLLLGEGGILALIGSLFGIGLALVYSRLLVQMLAALWPGGVLQSFLEPHWTVASLCYGAGGAFAVSLLTIAWVVRGLGKVPPRALLAGQTTDERGVTQYTESLWRIGRLFGVALAVLIGVGLLFAAPSMRGHEAQAGTFFGSGALFLTAGLTSVYSWMKRARHKVIEGHGAGTIARLGVRNAARNPARSLLTIGLLASSAFLLVSVESFRRRAQTGDGSIHAADGGFALIAESDLPIIRDLNSPEGRRELLDRLPSKQADADQMFKLTKFVALRARAGDDASCLNLYQPRAPRVLGVPRSLIQRGGFVLDGTLSPSAEEQANPWLVLVRDQEQPPAFGEANTVMWMLKSGLGQSVRVPDSQGEQTPLQIAGLLHDSVFQSSLLVSEERFLKLYPGHEGYNVFLIAPQANHVDEVRRLLEERGFSVSRSEDRLAAFLAVENTYLTTFQALGGLGLLLGSLGLSVVLLRAVWERRAELALLRALGWGKRMVGWLVLAENVFLLLIGLVVGTVSALLSISPQLATGAGAVPVVNLLMLFAVVLAVALAAGTLAVVGSLRAAIIPALRRE